MRKKLLILNYEFPPIGGGAGGVCKQLAINLSEKYEIEVITSHFKGLPVYEEINGYKVRRYRVFRDRADGTSIFGMLLYVFLSLLPLYLDVLKFKPDVIHCHFAVPSGVLAYIINKLTGIPYIITIHGGDVPSFIPELTKSYFSLIKPFTRPIWQNAFRVVGVCEWMKEISLVDYPGLKNIVVINNACNKDFFYKISLEKKIEEEVKFLFIGRFVHQKRIDKVLKAIKLISNYFDCRIEMIGDGPYMPEVIRMISELGLEDKVLLHGWQSGEFVRGRIHQLDIVLMPSDVESLPLVLLEAIAGGAPVIASDLPCVREVINKTNGGVLVNDWSDSKELKEAVDICRAIKIKFDAIESWRDTACKYAELFEMSILDFLNRSFFKNQSIT